MTNVTRYITIIFARLLLLRIGICISDLRSQRLFAIYVFYLNIQPISQVVTDLKYGEKSINKNTFSYLGLVKYTGFLRTS